MKCYKKTKMEGISHGWWVNFSEKNHKLKPSKEERFLIFNIPSVITCIGATEMCKRFCYARITEIRRCNTVPQFRKRNLEHTRKDTFVYDVCRTIDAHMSRGIYNNADIVTVRVHESGDFYSARYLWDWINIARYCRKYKNLRFRAYTKSFEILEPIYRYRPSNFVIMASVWEDTPQKHLDIIERLGMPIYTASKEDAIAELLERGWELCTCESCNGCSGCDGTKNTTVKIH